MIEFPLVSVLMPAYNAENFISEAIGSILNQTHSNWELLILNDGSTDKTLKLIKSFSDSRISIINQEQNQGYLESCNRLFDVAKGDFVTFLDADDTCPSNRLELCVNSFKTNPKVDFLTTGFQRKYSTNQSKSTYKDEVDYHRYSTDSDYYPIICCASIFLRQSLLKKVGGYHPFFKEIGSEDYHWLFRLSLAGSGSHLTEILYYYRQHDGQTHNMNQNPLKYFSEDIDKEIRSSIIQDNFDLLQNDVALKSRWQQRLAKNQSELGFRQASSLLNRNEFKNALFASISAIAKELFSFTSWHRFLILVYSITIRWVR